MNLLERPLVVVGSIVAALVFLILLLVQKYSGVLGLGIGLAILVGVGVVSRIPQRFAGGDIGFELCLFFTILVALRHGFLLGGAVGVLSMGISGYATKERPDDVGVAVLGFLAVAGLVSVFGGIGGLVFTGVLYTLIYDVMVSLVYLATGHNPVGCIKFTLTHVLWNYVMFRSFGEIVLAIL